MIRDMYKGKVEESLFVVLVFCETRLRVQLAEMSLADVIGQRIGVEATYLSFMLVINMRVSTFHSFPSCMKPGRDNLFLTFEQCLWTCRACLRSIGIINHVPDHERMIPSKHDSTGKSASMIGC